MTLENKIYWNQIADSITRSNYYAGTCLEYILPEIHKRLYGTSFTNLPLELGGKLKE